MAGRAGPHTLAELQNIAKRDPESYKADVEQQVRHFKSTMEIFQLNPSQDSKQLGDLVNFLSAMAPSYPDMLKSLPTEIVALLEAHYATMDADLRSSLCRSLILMRNRDLVAPTGLLELFFKLFRCHDKSLREMLYTHIVQDIKRINAKHKNNQVNKTLQNFMYTMLSDDNAIAAKKSLDVMVELYRKRVWNDAKTVNVCASACFSSVAKIMVTAVKFFLSADDEQPESDDEGDGSKPSYSQMLHRTEHLKKTKKRQRALDQALKREHRKDKKATRVEVFNFSALHLIHDPQGMAEKLFDMLRTTSERFEVRLMVMNLISRLIGVHQLLVLNFYPFVQRYLQPRQQDVTLILTYLAQAAHELVPEDVLEPVLMTISNNFVSDRSAPEVMAVGLNAVREVCSRCPLAMNETLLQDLVQYKSFKDKSVMMAARSLIQLFREKNPALLHRRDRGRPEEGEDGEEVAPLQYGAVHVADHVPGTELLSMLEDIKPEEAAAAAGSDEEGGDWESASDDDDGEDEDEWITVQHSDDEKDDATPAPDAVQDVVDKKERLERARALAASRVLTDEDFAKIKELKLKKKLMPSVRSKRDAATLEQDLLNPDSLLPDRKKRRQTKEERLASVMEGREDRGRYGARKGRLNENASTTNKEKSKRKNPMMIKYKLENRRKDFMSATERKAKQHESHEKDRRNRY
eukprot:m.230644 g.230644  ORF g.230644 m.230644 type:complete len:691 (-) comp12092_c0_seq1:145-2217(-)